MKENKIGIVGIGVVGSACFLSFQNKYITTFAYDKYKNIGKFQDLLQTETIFLCLPTPYNQEMKSYDKSALNDVCQNLAINEYQGLVVIKSTVEPTTTETFAKNYPRLRFVHNPEFLTAGTALEDFENQKHIILGTTISCTDNDIQTLKNFYHRHYPSATISICTSIESESVKIFCNSFYAVKIQFFNELYLATQLLNVNFEIIRSLMIKNGWINEMHTSVPGPDGKLSYGGMCFPKDTQALNAFLKHNNLPHAVLEAAIQERNKQRDD